MAAVQVLVNVLALVKADTVRMVVVVEARGMATPRLMTRVMETVEAIGTGEVVVATRKDAEEVTMNLRETVAIPGVDQRTRGTSL